MEGNGKITVQTAIKQTLHNKPCISKDIFLSKIYVKIRKSYCVVSELNKMADLRLATLTLQVADINSRELNVMDLICQGVYFILSQDQ